jgi:hypothetical protein
MLHDIAATIDDFMKSGPGMPASVIYLLVSSIPVILFHELGHAVVAARRLGGPVHVVVGSTGRLISARVGQINMGVNALPNPSRVAGSASFDASHASARDLMLVALAGPLASLLGLVLTAWALGLAPAHGAWHNLLWGATAAGVCGVLNIIPFSFQERRNGPTIRTDGLLALDAARAAWLWHSR